MPVKTFRPLTPSTRYITIASYDEITDNRITGNHFQGIAIAGNHHVVLRNVTDANFPTFGSPCICKQIDDFGAFNIVGPLQQSPSTDPNANIGFP